MVVLGAFAGKYIRNVSNAPLVAFGAAAKGWQEGNMTAYKNATEQWKQSSERLKEINRQQLARYHAILQNDNLTIDEQMNQMKIAATINRDRIMYDRTNTGDINGIAQALAAREQSTLKWEAHTQQMVDILTAQNETAQARADEVRATLASPQGQQWFKQFSASQQLQINGFLKTYPAQQAPEMQTTEEPRTVGAGAMQTPSAGPPRLRPGLAGPPPPDMKPTDRAARSWEIEAEMQEQGYTPEQIKQHFASTGQRSGEEWAKFHRLQKGTGLADWSQEELDYAREQYALTNKLPPGVSRDPELVNAIIRPSAGRAAAGAGATVAAQADIKGLTTALGTMEKQKAAIDAFESKTKKDGQSLQQLADEVDRTGSPVLERWIRAGRKAITGDPDVSKFNAQLRLYATDVARVVANPSLTGVLTDSARGEIAEFLPQSITARQIRNLLPLFNRDMDNRSVAINAEINELRRRIAAGGAAPAEVEQTPAAGAAGANDPLGLR
jgi:hypothetical protein